MRQLQPTRARHHRQSVGKRPKRLINCRFMGYRLAREFLTQPVEQPIYLEGDHLGPVIDAAMTGSAGLVIIDTELFFGNIQLVIETLSR